MWTDHDTERKDSTTASFLLVSKANDSSSETNCLCVVLQSLNVLIVKPI